AVGIMQAIGGTRARIASIYFRQALLLGAAAVAVGLPAGIAGARPICDAMARFLNFDVLDRAVPFRVFALATAVGLLLPLAAAAWPVWRGCRVTVREALSDDGVSGGTFGAAAFERWIAGIGGTARPVLLAIRNVLRRRTRLFLTAAALAAGGVFFLSALNVRASLVRTLDRFFARRRFDLTVAVAGIAPEDAIERAVAKTDGIARAEGWIAAGGAIAGEAGSPESPKHRAGDFHGGGATHRGPAGSADRFAVFAIPPGTPLLDMEIVEGRALRAGDTDAIVVNTALAANDRRFRVGGRVPLALGPETRNWRIVGIAREPFSPPTGYLPKTFFDAFHPGGANSVRVALRRGGARSIESVREDLERNLGAEGVRVASTVSAAESRFGFDQHMLMIAVFLGIVSGLLGAIGGLGLVTTMSLNVLERRRELGVLRALGATPAVVSGMLAAESAVAGLLNWTVAVAAAWPVSRILGSAVSRLAFRTKLDFAFAPEGAAIWLGVCLFFGAAASVWPAWSTARVSVREALEQP
ncbi:MAG TPA: ABC transporter permease, partial [Thermoanaerobaculia bacterium]|nr:ABC transporter permease [Thermoanaerobaculia bacterium]